MAQEKYPQLTHLGAFVKTSTPIAICLTLPGGVPNTVMIHTEPGLADLAERMERVESDG